MNQFFVSFYFFDDFLFIEFKNDGILKILKWGFKMKFGVQFDDLLIG